MGILACLAVLLKMPRDTYGPGNKEPWKENWTEGLETWALDTALL